MQTKLIPYLSFKDNARQAMEYYNSVFGGKLVMNTFKEYQASSSPAEDNLIMHAELNAGEILTFFASDTPARMEYHPGTNISMSLTGENEEELKGWFSKLSKGGKVTMPLEKAVWGDTFGMCMDQFGVGWMVNITGKKA